jgi:hypothetical protein
MASLLDKPSTVVLWLTPMGRARDFFRATIKRLASACDAPVFEPHLTLGFGSLELMERVSAHPIVLPVVSVNCSGRFTMTLFVRFELAPELAQLRDSLGMETAEFDPHLSLLYKEMPLSEKKEFASSISLPFASTTFDAVEAVCCPAETASRVDIESWKRLGSKPLTHL